MTVEALLAQLSELGMTLWFEGDRLRFRAARGALAPAQRAELVARKPEIIAHLRAEAARRETRLALSYGQRSLWFVHQEDPLGATYNVAFPARIVSALNVVALEHALQALVDRHAALRTTFPLDASGMPVQRVAGAMPLQLARVDAAGLDEPGLRGRVDADYRRPFDLAHGPVFRAALYTRAPSDHVLLMTVHHIAADGWSLLRLIEELGALYAEADRGVAAELSRPEVEYADFTRWQAGLLDSAEGARLERYWTRRMAAPRAMLELPPDRRRPSHKSDRGAVHAFEVDGALSGRLRLLAREENATLFMVLLAAFKVLLLRYTGTRDLIVGTPGFGRSRPEFARVIGDFVNTLALRTELTPELSFRSALARVRQTVLEALDAQDYPFPLLVERLQPARDASRSPLFETLFVLQRFEQLEALQQVLVPTAPAAPAAPGAPASAMAFGGLQLQPFELDLQERHFDLTLQVVEQGGALQCHFKYASELFDRATMVHLARHFETLLGSIVETPQGAIGRLPLHDATERARWAAPVPSGASAAQPLHRHFEAQAARAPDAIAVSAGDRHVSYGELNRRANRLAHRLRERGVGPNTLVGLFADRSVELVTGLLAILKAGGAYLPLDLHSPADRLAFILADAGAGLLLTQGRWRDRLPADAAVQLLDDELAEHAEHDPAPLPASSCDDTIYVIYTSGSTGTPKGTVLSHRAVDRLFSATAPWFGFDAHDVWTLFHSIAFDFSVWEFWGALRHGGRLVIVPQETSRSPEAFLALLQREAVTVLNQTPTAFGQLLPLACRAGAPALGALRHVVFGGEALELQGLRPWFDRYGDQRPMLVNMYGITETCVHVTYRPIRLADLDAGLGSVIGVPIPDLRLLLLDANGEPVPRGAVGEIFVGGPGLARGYLNRPDLTAARFVDDPFHPGDRLYRSGDLARHRADGELEYLGRIDDQVKLRGFRIELGEIEAALARQPGVEQAVVVVREDAPGDRRLVAYVVGAAEEPALREALRKLLPDYMVPGAIVALPALPLTGNGKVDRRALPAPAALGGPARLHEPPHGPTETTVARIWAEVLGVPAVGRGDDFFGLGGHSLLATQVLARVREQFDGTLALRMLFDHPRLQDFAAAVDEARTRPAQPAQPAASALGIDPVPDGLARLSFAQERMWLLHALDPQGAAYNIPAALRLVGELDVAALGHALRFLVERHEALRTVFVVEAGQPMQQVQAAPAVVLETRDLQALGTGAPAAALAAAGEAARASFELARGPVLRALLWRIGASEHLLLLVVHHIAADQWSMGLLGRELGHAYAALQQGQPPDLPPLALRYRDVAAWQRLRFSGETLAPQLDYWRRRLDGVTPLQLPTDRPRAAILGAEAAWHAEPLSAELLTSLEAYGRTHGATLFMTLLAAYMVLLHRHSGQGDIAVAVPIVSREQRATEALVGSFVNTLVMRGICPGDLPFVDLLQQVRTTALDAYAHQELPFAKLVEELNPSRGPATPPLAQVLFALQSAPMGDLAFPGLTWEPVVVDRGAAPFELGLYVDTVLNRSALFEYSTALFDAATVARLAAHYVKLLESIVAQPAGAPVTLDRLPMLTASETHRLQVEFNATEAALDPPVYSRRFEARVRLAGASRAVRFEGASWSYAELNRRANRIARRLQALGVGRGALVGVCMHRSLDLMAALLGVQKSGGAYVPLDPGFPPERLAFMLEDSQARVLLTADDAADGIELPAGLAVLSIESAALPAEACAADEDLPEAAVAADAAYVIYTSGSTGRPKGVVVPHGALVNFLESMRHEPGLGATDVLAAVTTISFDIAGLELYLPWLVGGAVELVGRDVAVDGAALAAQLEASGATVLQATPATWRLLLEAGWRGAPGFRALCGGEGLPRELADALLARTDELWNLYGPTETTIWSTLERVRAGDGPVRIGRPIANTQVHVLGAGGEHVPIGVAGELWIGGAGVATGYHRRPDLSAERFLPDRFSADPKARLYRTGDLARWDADGRLEHLGRIDQQVKVRGFRIELGEIESVLAAHPAVRQVVVDARPAAPGDLRLVAYVVYLAGQDLTVSEVRRHLRGTLPDYMIPSVVMTLETIPLTPNGKVDRRALPDPFRGVAAVAEHEPPASGHEAAVARLWGDVLQVDGVGAQANFFELGGHSLLALRLVAAMERDFGRRIDPRTLFFQNLRQVAAALALPVAA